MIRCNGMTEHSLSVAQRQAYERLTLPHLSLNAIASHTFDGLSRVLRIEISQSASLESIETLAFNSLLNVSEILIQNMKRLTIISCRAFNNLPKLRYLSISNTGISLFPDLTAISSLESSFFLDICDNINLQIIPSNAFLGMTKEHIDMNLYNNGFKEVQENAFNGTKINKLILKNNKKLQTIHKDAFEGALGPSTLFSASAGCPWDIYAKEPCCAEQPGSLQEAHLTYPSHCCSLLHRSSQRILAVSTDYSSASLSVDFSVASNAAGSYEQDPQAYGNVGFQYPDFDFYLTRRNLRCTPEPDAFNPCEDIVGFVFLRVAIWLINMLAIIGNLTVLVVFFTSHHKLTVPRFLIFHLAFADFCIGIYLFMIGTVDLWTRGDYSQHAIEWQTGVGCNTAGFLSVFGGELSVYTLTVVTLERWHTITNAIHLERRMGLAHAAAIMAAGWLLCLAMGILPLLGVSSYSKVSVCLPADIDTPLAQAFVTTLLLLNVVAFCVVSSCYIRIYLAVRKPEFAGGGSSDARMAKRMAVLVFTDFICMAPISFFAISAAFRMPLITVSSSKILLVLFFPINSCANPFLYAIFTRAFRQDACMLLSALRCCKDMTSQNRLQGALKMYPVPQQELKDENCGQC